MGTKQAGPHAGLRRGLLGLARAACAVFCVMVLAGAALAESDELGCGPRRLGEDGPFDYRTASVALLYRVEHYHFFPEVEFLSKSQEARMHGANLEFTLRYFPNHHRALSTMTEFSVRRREPHPIGMRYDVECWFLRAKTMAPDDALVSVLHGIYLLRTNHPKEALLELDAAQTLGGDDVNVSYNIGLAYFELGRYKESLEFAKKAYAAGHPLPGLRNKLMRVNAWQD